MQWPNIGSKKRIDNIKGLNGMVTETPEILKVATNYYKELFSWENRGDVSLDSQFWDSSEMVSPEENLELVAPFSEQDIKRTIFDSYAEGAPGPYGLSFLFYQKIWEIIKGDLFNLVQVFQEGKLDLFRINFATLTLIPRVEDATKMKNYRHISLLNYSFKIFG
jgi:hypothetical protein